MKVMFLMQDTGVIYGQERATIDLVAGLREAGQDPHVLLIGETRLRLARSMVRQALRDRELPHEVIDTDSRFSLSPIRRIRELLQQHRADVLHTQGYKANLHGGLAARWGRITPIVSTVHGWLCRPIRREQFYDWLDRRILRRFQRVVVLSRFYEQALLAAGIRAQRLCRIPSGLNLQDMDPTPPPDTGFTVGILGRLSYEKNHAMFLRAAARVCQDGTPACFLIAGDGPDRPEIERQVRALGLSNNVILPGYLSRSDFFGQVHVVVLTSRIENLPYTILEAMAWGRPVIATRVGGVSDLIDDQQTGLLIEPDDHEGLARAITRLAQDPGLRDRFACHARRKLEREFALSNMVTKHIALYEDLLNKAPQRVGTASSSSSAV
jgi:glycosyltransferase involved in cell wall biosynthesis